MFERVKRNEKRLDEITESIHGLDKALDKFKKQKSNIKNLNKYYESKTWLEDFDNYDPKKFKNIKAGVLSEDAIWNMNEEISYLIDEMKSIIKYFDKEKE